MKKISEKKKAAILRLIFKRRRKICKKRRYYVPNSTQKQYIDIKKDLDLVEAKVRHNNLSISAPQNFNIFVNEDESMQFLKFIRRAVETKIKGLSIRLETISSIEPISAMLLASEIHRWKLIRKEQQRTRDSNKWHDDIKRMLCDIGTFDLVEVVNQPKILPQEAAERFIKIRSGTKVDLERVITEIGDQVAQIETFIDSDPTIYGAIQEAITNVIHWAYRDSDNSLNAVIRDRWWFLASYNEEVKRFTLLVYDHGRGIPKTIRKKFREEMQSRALELLSKFLPISQWNDAYSIEAAFKYPRSASGHDYRGKGLVEMRNLLDRFTSGRLQVMSGRGVYTIHCDGRIENALKKYDIGGTLVAWEIYDTVS